jgi:hypothetical protein
MRAIKHQETTYNSLHLCLEAHFGNRHTARTSNAGEYQEAEQGPRTVPFQSRYPLQLDYMRRRKGNSLVQTAFGFINFKRTSGK